MSKMPIIKNDLIFICYTEVLLMYAEAGNKMDQIDGMEVLLLLLTKRKKLNANMSVI